MKKSQLNAISRSYSAKRRKEQEQEASNLNLLTAFENQEEFTTLNGFLNAFKIKSKKFVKAINQVILNLDKKIIPYCKSNRVDLQEKAKNLENYKNYLINLIKE